MTEKRTPEGDSLQALGDKYADNAIAKLTAIPDASWPARLIEFVEVITAALKRLRVAPEVAQLQARHVVAELANYCGGRPIYLPRGARLKAALLHRSIYLEATAGKDTDELARRHGITMRAVQRIVAEQAELHRARRAREAQP